MALPTLLSACISELSCPDKIRNRTIHRADLLSNRCHTEGIKKNADYELTSFVAP
ncbi:hypothetical protein Bwad005_26460 [Bilophila wadsworthia]